MSTIASYGLAIVGFGMVMLAIIRAFAWNLRYIYTRPLLINLLRADANRAEQLCRTVTGGTFFDAIAAAIKTVAMMDTSDPTVIASASRPAYDAAGMGVTIKWKQLVMKGKLGAGLACGGVVLGMSGGGFPIIPAILAGISVIGLVWVVVHKTEVERCIILARAEILPEVDRAFIEGRYRRLA